jgi:chromosome partitioning protein
LSIPGVIVFATGKGGAGKSTLARSLAGHWLTLGHKPAIIDADPQASIVVLHDVDGPMAAVTVREAPEEGAVAEAIEELRSSHGMVLVDTAGFRNRTTIIAMLASDLVLIPLKPSAEDLREAVETYNLIQELNTTPERTGRPIAAHMVLTMTMRGTVIARQVRHELETVGYPLLKAELMHRVAYPEAATRGLAPSLIEPEGAAARDLAAIAKEIGKLSDGDAVKAA